MDLGIEQMSKGKIDSLTIGVLGGAGTRATVYMFKQYADVFEAKKEWDRPRLIIDNRCTMPSRVRAVLYGEKREQLIDEMTESLEALHKNGCNQLLIGCNTAHVFLPDVIERKPELQNCIVSIIEEAAKAVSSSTTTREVGVLASEGTIESGIYQKVFLKYGLSCNAPSRKEYGYIRDCIEAVKCNQINEEVVDAFKQLISKYPICVLGCTELPILWDTCSDELGGIQVIDPVRVAFENIKAQWG